MILAPTPVIAADETLSSTLRALRTTFVHAGIESAGLDARCLLEAATGFDRADLVAHGNEILGDTAKKLNSFVRRRLAGEPVARILGEREFWGLPFTLSPATLVPRPETETVVEEVLRRCDAGHGRRHPWRILDLGTGTGCILVALLVELPAAWGVGLDRSVEALATAIGNARRNGVAERAAFVASDWTSAVAASFDFVVSNPPYISTAEIAGLPPEVRDHDPHLALNAGNDGLDAYRALLADSPRLLAPQGRIVLEIGVGQAWRVRALVESAELACDTSLIDLGGIERVLSAERWRAPERTS